MIAGYLFAVTDIAVSLVAVQAACGSVRVPTGDGVALLMGKLIGAGVVAFAPVYLVVRLFLWMISATSPLVFAVSFALPCVFVFAGLAQIPDVWLLDWEPGNTSDMVEIVFNEQLAAQLWGGYWLEPLFFTGVGIAFWLVVGASAGLVIWWSERKDFSRLNRSSV